VQRLGRATYSSPLGKASALRGDDISSTITIQMAENPQKAAVCTLVPRRSAG